jgi:hypothetical protein
MLTSVDSFPRTGLMQMIGDLTSRIMEFVWLYVWWIVLGLLFVGLVAEWVGRHRRRNTLRTLLGPAFLDEKTFVNRKIGISIDEASGQFALAKTKSHVMCAAQEIISVEYITPSVESIPGVLTIETTNQHLPRTAITTIFRGKRLGEIHGRLKAMQTQTKKNIAEEPTSFIRLEDAIIQLSVAVLSLAEAIRDKPATSTRSKSTE